MPNAHGTSQERTKVWKLEVQWYQATSYRRFNCHWLVQHYQSCCMVFVEGANQKVGKNSIPTWDVFMSFGNCEAVFQLWLDKIGLSNSWNGKILSCTTRPISCSSFCASQLLHRILHLWFAGSEHLCSHQMCSKVQVQIVACSKGLVNGLLDDSLSIEFGANTSLMCFRGSRHKNIKRTMATKLRAGVIDWLPNSIPLSSMCCCSNLWNNIRFPRQKNGCGWSSLSGNIRLGWIMNDPIWYCTCFPKNSKQSQGANFCRIDWLTSGFQFFN